MSELTAHFDQFLRERVYLHNITPKTREFYETAWKAFQRSQAGVPSRPASAPLITRADVQGFVIHLRDRGVTPRAIQTRMRANT